MFHMPGGFSDEQKATPEIQTYCDQVKSEVQKKVGINFSTYKAVSFICQTVAGTNYIVKIDVGDKKCIHVKIFVALPHTHAAPAMKGCQLSKTLKDPIASF